jgi:hypothetical protein
MKEYMAAAKMCSKMMICIQSADSGILGVMKTGNEFTPENLAWLGLKGAGKS